MDPQQILQMLFPSGMPWAGSTGAVRNPPPEILQQLMQMKQMGASEDQLAEAWNTLSMQGRSQQSVRPHYEQQERQQAMQQGAQQAAQQGPAGLLTSMAQLGLPPEMVNAVANIVGDGAPQPGRSAQQLGQAASVDNAMQSQPITQPGQVPRATFAGGPSTLGTTGAETLNRVARAAANEGGNVPDDIGITRFDGGEAGLDVRNRRQMAAAADQLMRDKGYRLVSRGASEADRKLLEEFRNRKGRDPDWNERQDMFGANAGKFAYKHQQVSPNDPTRQQTIAAQDAERRASVYPEGYQAFREAGQERRKSYKKDLALRKARVKARGMGASPYLQQQQVERILRPDREALTSARKELDRLYDLKAKQKAEDAEIFDEDIAAAKDRIAELEGSTRSREAAMAELSEIGGRNPFALERLHQLQASAPYAEADRIAQGGRMAPAMQAAPGTSRQNIDQAAIQSLSDAFSRKEVSLDKLKEHIRGMTGDPIQQDQLFRQATKSNKSMHGDKLEYVGKKLYNTETGLETTPTDEYEKRQNESRNQSVRRQMEDIIKVQDDAARRKREYQEKIMGKPLVTPEQKERNRQQLLGPPAAPPAPMAPAAPAPMGPPPVAPPPAAGPGMPGAVNPNTLGMMQQLPSLQQMLQQQMQFNPLA